MRSFLITFYGLHFSHRYTHITHYQSTYEGLIQINLNTIFWIWRFKSAKKSLSRSNNSSWVQSFNIYFEKTPHLLNLGNMVVLKKKVFFIGWQKMVLRIKNLVRIVVSIKVYVDKVAPTQAKNWGSPFWAGDSDVICQLALGKKL